jgi:hypothetical protein
MLFRNNTWKDITRLVVVALQADLIGSQTWIVLKLIKFKMVINWLCV